MIMTTQLIAMFIIPLAATQVARLVVYEDPFIWIRKYGKPFTCVFCMTFWTVAVMSSFFIPYNLYLIYVPAAFYAALKLP
jgi:hypothetical protein